MTLSRSQPLWAAQLAQRRRNLAPGWPLMTTVPSVGVEPRAPCRRNRYWRAAPRAPDREMVQAADRVSCEWSHQFVPFTYLFPRLKLAHRI